MKPSDQLKKRPASEALLIMQYASIQFGLDITKPKNWNTIYNYINHAAKNN